jgi:hypothetical protein
MGMLITQLISPYPPPQTCVDLYHGGALSAQHRPFARLSHRLFLPSIPRLQDVRTLLLHHTLIHYGRLTAPVPISPTRVTLLSLVLVVCLVAILPSPTFLHLPMEDVRHPALPQSRLDRACRTTFFSSHQYNRAV